MKKQATESGSAHQQVNQRPPAALSAGNGTPSVRLRVELPRNGRDFDVDWTLSSAESNGGRSPERLSIPATSSRGKRLNLTPNGVRAIAVFLILLTAGLLIYRVAQASQRFEDSRVRQLQSAEQVG